MKIPLSSPDITEPEIAAVVETLRTPQLSLGPRLLEFEATFIEQTGVPYAIAVSSGTAGLHLAIRALGVGPGDEVIVPSFTFIAAANCVRYEGATPVFVDIEPESLNLAPAAVEQAITSKTRAILVVHTFGRPANMAALIDIAQRHGLPIIEDACEALGASIDGRPAGSFGDIAVFAFYPNKQITTGEGGMILTPHAHLAQRLRAGRNQGRTPDAGWLQHAELGFNYRLSEVACTLGIGQMKRLESILVRRSDVADAYHRVLAGVEGLILPALPSENVRLSWFVYVVRLVPGLQAEHRDRIIENMEAQGIACGRYFAPIHLQPAYNAWRNAASLPVTESIATRTIALPFFNRITEPEIHRVANTLRQVLASVHG